MNTEKLLNNKKFLFALTVAVIIVLALIIYAFTNNLSSSEEFTNSESADLDLQKESETLQSHPIADLLPIINNSPYYYIGPYFVVDGDNLTFELEVAYETAEGQAAALSRLQGQDLSKYNPSQYDIHYTKIIPDAQN